MKNPYDDERDVTDYAVGPVVSRCLSALFVLLLFAPMLYDAAGRALGGGWSGWPWLELVSYQPLGQVTLRDHLREVEGRVDQLRYVKGIREQTQQWITAGLGEGNRKVVVAGGGWLFYRPEVEALTGWGPMKKEPYSVMKDPELARAPAAREVVLEFAGQLRERGVELLLVPLPVKAMLYHELLFRSTLDGPLYHPDQLAFYEALRGQGIRVLDLAPGLYDLKKRFPLFLKQDTHWTPEAMKRCAGWVADYVKKAFPELVGQLGVQDLDARIFDRKVLGDLVGLLGLADERALFEPEGVQLFALNGLQRDAEAAVTLLCDSFVNIYDDPTLGFAAEEGDTELMHGGFADHLSMKLGTVLDVIARNGAGTTATRREFAARPVDVVAKKKLVIWVLASRDLIYSPAAARAANVAWESVVFNPNRSREASVGGDQPGGGGSEVVLIAEAVEKSANQDPEGTPYADAMHGAVYQVLEVVSGEFDPKQEWQAVQWTFRGKKLLPPSEVKVGRRYELRLLPWDEMKEFHGLNINWDSALVDEFTAERWYVVDLKPL
jgi:hypothetical protein